MTTLYNCVEQKIISEHDKAWGKWVTIAEYHIGFHFCQPWTGIWGYSGHRLTKIGQVKILPAWYCGMSQSASHLKLISWTLHLTQHTSMVHSVTRSEYNRVPLGCARMGAFQHLQICSNCPNAIMSTKSAQPASQINVSNTLWNPCHK